MKGDKIYEVLLSDCPL